MFDLYADVPAILEHSERALAGEPVSTIVEVHEVTFESWYQPIFDGEAVTGVVGLSYDVTEREERRSNSNDRTPGSTSSRASSPTIFAIR